MKILTFLILFAIGSISNTTLDTNSNEFDVDESCIEILNVDFENMDDLNIELSDICDYNIWKIIIRPGGDWHCETGQNYQCMPCQDENDEQ